MNNLVPLKQKKSIFGTAQIIALGFFSIILFGALLLFLPFSTTSTLSFTDSLFLSTSAVSLTGLSVVPLATTLTPFGEVFLLILIQVGGLGFTTLASLLFIAIKKKITYKERLLLQESLNQDQTKGIVRLTKNVALYSFVCEGVGFLVLAPYLFVKNGLIGIWQALFTTVSAFCNAGADLFATTSNPFPSFIEFNNSPLFLLTISILIIVGGLGFSVVANLTYHFKSRKKLSLNTKTVLVFTAIFLFFGTLFTFVFEYNGDAFKGMNFFEKLLNSFFQSVTTRTAGFSSVAQDALSLPVKIMTYLFMFIGGAPASTAGGIKITTVAVILAAMMSGLKNRNDVSLFKHTISYRATIKAISSMVIGILIVIFVSILIIIIEKHTALKNTDFYTIENITFEVFSAFGTTGLSMGITPHLSVASKYLLIATMFFGRVGTITVGLLLFSNKSKQAYRYPEGHIMIG